MVKSKLSIISEIRHFMLRANSLFSSILFLTLIRLISLSSGEFKLKRGDKYIIVIGINGGCGRGSGSGTCGLGGGGATYMLKYDETIGSAILDPGAPGDAAAKEKAENIVKDHVPSHFLLVASGGGGAGGTNITHPTTCSAEKVENVRPATVPSGAGISPCHASGDPGLGGVRVDPLEASSRGSWGGGGGGGILKNGGGNGYCGGSSNDYCAARPTSGEISTGGKSFLNGLMGGVGGYYANGIEPDVFEGGCEGNGGLGFRGGGAASSYHAQGGTSYISDKGENTGITVMSETDRSNWQEGPVSDAGQLKVSFQRNLLPKEYGELTDGTDETDETDETDTGTSNTVTNEAEPFEVGIDNDFIKDVSTVDNTIVDYKNDIYDIVIIGIIIILLLLFLGINCKKK